MTKPIITPLETECDQTEGDTLNLIHLRSINDRQGAYLEMDTRGVACSGIIVSDSKKIRLLAAKLIEIADYIEANQILNGGSQ